MLNSMLISSVTMGQLQHKMDAISNNMANLDTAGFKRTEVSFNELLNQQYNNQPRLDREVGRSTPNGIRQGVGAALAQASLMMNQGSIKPTGRALDIAIMNEQQFFRVASNGEAPSLTRDGKFYLSPNPNDENTVNLVTGNGDFVLGRNGNIVLPANMKEIQISNTGQVRIVTQNNQSVVIDQLDMVNVMRPELLEALGGNKFKVPDNLEQLNLEMADIIQQAPVANISLQQGALEMSNVDLTKEMTKLIEAQRSYQFQAQALRMGNDMFGLINSLR